MKGVLYNYEFQQKNGEILKVEHQTIDNLLPQLEKLLFDNYGLKCRMSSQIIYNLRKRRQFASIKYKLFIKIERIEIDDNNKPIDTFKDYKEMKNELDELRKTINEMKNTIQQKPIEQKPIELSFVKDNKT
tara:strand:- start:108 stop:500 length:393 start_codon:yes stop_codon:yes gene_type:complete